jgi:hypothetical protein
MDNETNSEGASGKDSGKMKPGDKVWVLFEVVEGPYRGQIECKNGTYYIRPLVSEVKPVEPRVVELPAKKEPTTAQKLAERTLKALWATQPKPEPEPVVKESLNTESDKLNTVTFDIGDPVMSYDGRKGIVEAINLIAEFPITVRHSMREHVSYKFGGVKHDETTQAPDPVNPSHYKQGSIECIEAMKVALGGGFLGYLRGNAIKYLWKYDKKNGIEDLKKARWYLDRLIQEEESK